MILIGVDGKPLQNKLTGIGKYLLNLLTIIEEKYPDVKFLIFSNQPITAPIKLKNYEIIIDKLAFSKLKPMLWYKFFSFKLINAYKINYFLVGATFVPLFLKKCEIISIVHDVNSVCAPETMSKFHSITHRIFFKRDLFKATYLIANSFGTAEKVLKYYGRKSDLVLYPLINSSYTVLPIDLITKELINLNIDYPYILTVATFEPRKNIESVIKAFMFLKGNGEIKNFKLLLVGDVGWQNDNLLQLIKTSADIIQLGYVHESDMPYIYNGAQAFVFPSKYEGFGMPACEAVLCGKKPVVSNITELNEATQGYAYFTDPENNILLANAILRSINYNKLPLEDNLDLQLTVKKIQMIYIDQTIGFLKIFKNNIN